MAKDTEWDDWEHEVDSWERKQSCIQRNLNKPVDTTRDYYQNMCGKLLKENQMLKEENEQLMNRVAELTVVIIGLRKGE